MSNFTESIIILFAIIVCSRFLKRRSKLLQRYFIPSSLLAGLVGLLLGPQILGFVSPEVTAYWALFPKYLINVVFAGLFLGKIIPKLSEIWKTAAPQIAFGNTLAWGQYVIGFIIVMFFLGPMFGVNPLAAALIEISFEGGHGTAAGLASTFYSLGYPEGVDVALALATVSILLAVLSGIFILNWQWKKECEAFTEDDIKRRDRQCIRNGYNLINLGKKISTTPLAVIINLGAFAISIAFGYGFSQLLILLEELVLANFTRIRFFPYMPIFPLAMIGGLLLQLLLRRMKMQTFIQRRTAEIISTLALDILIASAISTLSLKVVGENFSTFIVLGLAGFIWILFSFFFLAPKMFPIYWFEKGLTNIGQSMGMTATGLMLNRLVDPSNTTRARESFAYKQLAFEPFMGGGLITASSIILIYEFGSWPVFIISVIIFVLWLLFGLRLGKSK